MKTISTNLSLFSSKFLPEQSKLMLVFELEAVEFWIWIGVRRRVAVIGRDLASLTLKFNMPCTMRWWLPVLTALITEISLNIYFYVDMMKYFSFLIIPSGLPLPMLSLPEAGVHHTPFLISLYFFQVVSLVTLNITIMGKWSSLLLISSKRSGEVVHEHSIQQTDPQS